MSTAAHYLASRHHMSAKAIQKASEGKITARTVRKARQGMKAALGRIQDFIENNEVAPPAALNPDPVKS